MQPRRQEFWEHCEHFKWDTGAMFPHCYRLADMLGSTKECVEDLFGSGVDLQRSNKNPWKTTSVEKLHFLQSYWVRLDRGEWVKLKAQSGDFVQTRGMPARKHVNVGSHCPSSSVSKTFRLACLKKRCKGQGVRVFKPGEPQEGVEYTML